MKTKIITLVAVVMLFGTSLLANAAVIELPLAAEGEYDINSQYWTTDFDLGVTFTEISNVYIDWSGEITAGLAVQGPMGPPDPFPLEVGIYASLGFNPDLRRTTVWGGEATYPDPELFDLLSQIGPSGTEVWSDLLDGQHTITIGYEAVIMADGYYVEHGSVVLNSATLVVDGVPVPEPATLLLLGLGGLALLRKRKG